MRRSVFFLVGVGFILHVSCIQTPLGTRQDKALPEPQGGSIESVQPAASATSVARSSPDSGHVFPDTVGPAASLPTSEPPSFLPVVEWIGHKFIFLPQPKSLQKYGYLAFTGGKDMLKGVTYEEAVGRIGTVVNVTKKDRFPHAVTIQMEDSGQVYVGRVLNWTVMGIARVADIRYAQNAWGGKTLWTKDQLRLHKYDAASDATSTIIVYKHSPVKVVDVMPGMYEHKPVRLLLKTASGDQGYKDLNVSGTNTRARHGPYNRLAHHFSTGDPGKPDQKGEGAVAHQEERAFDQGRVKLPAIDTSPVAGPFRSMPEEEGRTYREHAILEAQEGEWNDAVIRSISLGMTMQEVMEAWGRPDDTTTHVTGNIRLTTWWWETEHAVLFKDGQVISMTGP